jgi:murein DD-endopeptidase MepM/ murein hydrolase activator NlpD
LSEAVQIEDDSYPEYQAEGRSGVDFFALVALAFIFFFGFILIRDRARGADTLQANAQISNNANTLEISNAAVDPAAIAPPYDKFVVTQGPHGFSYGQMAIDIAAGKGTTIKSPINGVVTHLYTDQYGNPTLVIENANYRITLLHGKYTVTVGDHLTLGQPIGQESNKGLTTDMQGKSCKGRNCGYHTHINIFDKRIGRNVNPLQVLGIQ